jgi:hypothetical protein
MNAPIKERVEALRHEIAEIQKQNLVYLQTSRANFIAMNDHARRERRLNEIKDELRAMTACRAVIVSTGSVLKVCTSDLK